MRLALIIILVLGLEIAARAAHADLKIQELPGWLVLYCVLVPFFQDLKELFRKDNVCHSKSQSN